MATTTVGWKHPQPTFYWEHQPTDGAWQDVANLNGYTNGQGTDTLDLASATAGETGFLRCTLTNPTGGSVTTNAVALSGASSAPVFTVDISNQSPYQGDNVTFGPVTATGNPAPTYLWEAETSDGGNVWDDIDTVFAGRTTGQGTDTMVISNMTPADNRDVRVRANNSEGEDISQASLTVRPPLAFTTQPQNLEITAT